MDFRYAIILFLLLLLFSACLFLVDFFSFGKVGACYFLDIFNKWAGSAIGNDSTATGAIRAVDGCPPSLIPCLKCLLSYHSRFLSLLI